MRIGVTGSSGLLGSALVPLLRSQGHEVVRFVRRDPATPQERRWDPASRRLAPEAVADLDAVVNLAGAGVASRRWSAARKRVVLESRVDATSTVATAAAEAAAAGTGPRTLLSSSGINFYGDTGDQPTDESGATGGGFLAEVTRQWEAATVPAQDAGLRVATMRTGIVLGPGAEIIDKQSLLFRLGLGAPLASGRQWQSWISLRDTVRAVSHLLTADVEGPVNLVGPHPVTNRDFTRAFGRAVHRPTLPIAVPRLALRIAIGPAADEIAVMSMRIVPGVLAGNGFTFADTDLVATLRDALGRSPDGPAPDEHRALTPAPH